MKKKKMYGGGKIVLLLLLLEKLERHAKKCIKIAGETIFVIRSRN